MAKKTVGPVRVPAGQRRDGPPRDTTTTTPPSSSSPRRRVCPSWLPLLIIVACLCLGSVIPPSLSKYNGAISDNGGGGGGGRAEARHVAANRDWAAAASSSSSAAAASRGNGTQYRTGNDVVDDAAAVSDGLDRDRPPPTTDAKREVVDVLEASTAIAETNNINGTRGRSAATNATAAKDADAASATFPSPPAENNTGVRGIHEHSPPDARSPSYNYTTTDVDIVSLTVRDDFFVLFNRSAIPSWLRHIKNVRSVTFIGPAKDHDPFIANMGLHYPHLNLVTDDDDDGGNSLNISSNSSSNNGDGGIVAVPIRYVHETHWITTYKNRYQCNYPAVCQQLIKLHVFDLRTRLGIDHIGDNVLVVDSDTVWSRDAVFVHPDDGGVRYWETVENDDRGIECDGMDPVKFTEAITIGSSLAGPRRPTLTPYDACVRPEYPNATGARHIVHHMLFQYDVMMHLHAVIKERWNTSTVWEAFVKCHTHTFCQSRVAEYELYFSFVRSNYPERVRVETLTDGEDYMGGSAICSAEEMECCEKRGVLLKGCHDHRIKRWKGDPREAGTMCCPARWKQPM